MSEKVFPNFSQFKTKVFKMSLRLQLKDSFPYTALKKEAGSFAKRKIHTVPVLIFQ
jgi:hypothetical protein